MRHVCLFLMIAMFVVASAPAETVVIPTTFGIGADAGAGEEVGGDSGNAVGNSIGVRYNGNDRHSDMFVRFDLSQIVPGSITSAEMHLFTWRSQTTQQHNVWGLNDGVSDGYNTGDGLTSHQGEFWAEDGTFKWSTAPEMVVDGSSVRAETFANSANLGNFTAPGSQGANFIALSGTNLVNFLNADTNGVVTMIIERISSSGGNYVVYTTKETTTLNSGASVPAGSMAPYLVLEAQSYAVSNPLPADNAADVDAAGLTLSWDAPSAPGTFTYDVYMSSPSDPSDPNLLLVSGDQSGTSYTPSPQLAYQQGYNWRVDSRQGGSVVAAGNEWSFETGGGVSNLSPTDGSEKVGYAKVLLDWDAADWVSSFDVYFSDNPGDLGTPVNTTETELLVAVDPNTVYYWAVDTKDAGGSVILAGETLSFSSGVMIAHWKLDETSGTVAADSSGNGYDMDVSAVDPNGTAWTDAVIRGGLEMVPPPDYAAVNTSIGMGDLDQVSASVWLNRSDFAERTNQYPFNIRGLHELTVGITTDDNGLFVWFIDDGVRTTWTPGITIQAEEWYHVVVTYDLNSSPRCKLYLNGSYVAGTNMSSTPKTLDTFQFGGRVGGPMDDARVYNAALSAQDVADLYAEDARAKNPDPADTEDRTPSDVVCAWDPGYDITGQTFQISETDDFSTLLDSATLAAGATSYDPLGGTNLDLDTVYYWRILSEQGSGTWTVEGTTWSFKTIGPVATDPDPADTEVDVAQNKVLGWLAGANYNPNTTDEHQVYIAAGTTEAALPPFPTATVQSNAFDPDLDYETAYVWRVDELIGGTLYTGDVWSFTTGARICDPELAGDTNGDCVVDMTDFANMVANWLECTLVNGDCP